ncbi:hypothetical protein D9M69_507350 [compost metagenome]
MVSSLLFCMQPITLGSKAWMPVARKASRSEARTYWSVVNRCWPSMMCKVSTPISPSLAWGSRTTAPKKCGVMFMPDTRAWAFSWMSCHKAIH